MRRDPLSGRIVLVAPARGRRPGIQVAVCPETTGAEPCPFCEGREAETPPETFAIASAPRRPDEPGWRVRVVPNRYPALADPVQAPPVVRGFATAPAYGRHEVVVHTPTHTPSLACLSPAQLADVAAAWRARAEAARAAGFAYLHALVNEGRAAGASRLHTHSQLVWLPEVPPTVAAEAAGGPACRVCEVVHAERAAGERVVADDGALAVIAPFAGTVPYELVVAPVHCAGDAFADAALEQALAALADAVRRLRTLVPEAPFNAWLHTAPLGGGRGHWHLHVLPRLTVLAGLELGAGLYVNPLPPEEGAALLRAAG